MGRARALLKSITTSKTGLYYLYGRYPSQILGDPEHTVRTGKAAAGVRCDVGLGVPAQQFQIVQNRGSVGGLFEGLWQSYLHEFFDM